MVRRFVKLLGELSRERQLIIAFWGIVAIFGILKLFLRLPLSIFDIGIPQFGLGGGFVLIGLGLVVADPRGLAATVVGTLVATLSGIALLALSTDRGEVLIFGLPLALGAGTGLAVFCHSVLHGRPTLARTGMTLVVVGFAAVAVLAFAVLVRVSFRGEAATGLIIALTALGVVVAAITILTADGSGRARGGRR